MTVPFRVKALYEYSSPHEDDLNFDSGQIITVTEEEDDDWYGGEYVDGQGAKRQGIFPRNFVEKYEPTAPPRPTKSRSKKGPEVSHQEAATSPLPGPSNPASEKPATREEPEPEHEETQDHDRVAAERPGPAASVPAASKTLEPPRVTSTAAVPKPVEQITPKPRAAPPPVSEKPSSNSFKDRIAAFNKPAAPPVAPFKPTGLGAGAGASGFVKKPFVAPPPSRNAYVPPPREKPATTLYRREEDPEIKEREAENLDQAEKAGLLPSEQPQEDDEDSQPKPTSLKERIALLQKQQMEQAQRHAEAAAAKKEKPKKPQKKRPEIEAHGDDAAEAGEESIPPALERTETADTEPRTSTDDGNVKVLPARRRPSRGPRVDELHDGSEADMSGAGDTTEGLDDTTEREDSEEAVRHNTQRAPTASTSAAAAPHRDAHQRDVEEEDEQEEAQEDEDETADPEARRKEELRARMAKMSGGMGFHGMFGAPVAPAVKAPAKKAPKPAEPIPADEEPEETYPTARAPPVLTPMALPGMGIGIPSSTQKHQEDQGDDNLGDDGEEVTPVPSRGMPPPLPTRAAEATEDEEDEATTPALSSGALPSRWETGGPPPIPAVRPIPPSGTSQARAPPPPPPPAPPAELNSLSDGSESDDELSGGAKDKDSGQGGLHTKRSPPMPSHPIPSLSSSRPADFTPSSPPTSTTGKRMSRPPPPIPGSAPAPPPLPLSSRPPPPPPPPPPPSDTGRQPPEDGSIATPTRPPRAGEEEDEEVTEYEGDYDTDIASSVPHKDALKAHAREASLEDSIVQSPTREAPPSIPPPVPTAAVAPRAMPPPVPNEAAPPEKRRQSTDAPRAAPPPRPAAKDVPGLPTTASADKYDAYHYPSPPQAAPLGSVYSQRTPKIEEEPPSWPGRSAAVAGSSPSDRRAPASSAPSTRPNNRPSLDMPRTSTGNRRSTDVHRPSVESDFIANEVDLAVQSGWWKQAHQVPPVLQGRKDIHFESQEATTTNQGAKTVITRDVFVLFQDYSQTIVTVRYDPYNPADVEMDQRHEPPPRALRQDQMEEFYERYGRQISNAATLKKDTVVGDGTPQGFVMELLRPLSGALAPVGTRSYGALVYANMGNASTQQQDVIRAGDVISFRNAKFQGKHGPMHAKYSAEVGKPDHVAVVAEWDGTKKKVRAWEQGRENKKVKLESYKLDDLRSGEVKIWRVVPRTWIGWNIQP